MTEHRMTARIRALLTKAESTDSADEQAALIAKAQELLAKYNIDAAKLQAAGEAVTEDVTSVRIDVARPRQRGGNALLSLVYAVAHANGAVAVGHLGSQIGIQATIIGFPSEIRAVEMLFDSLCRQLDHAAAYAVAHHKPAGVHGLTYRISYTHGWGNTVAGRLYEAREVAVTRATGEDTGTGATSTALVLRSRDEQVQARTQELFPRLGTFKIGYRPEVSGYRQGQNDGRRAALGGDLGHTTPARPLPPAGARP